MLISCMLPCVTCLSQGERLGGEREGGRARQSEREEHYMYREHVCIHQKNCSFELTQPQNSRVGWSGR